MNMDGSEQENVPSLRKPVNSGIDLLAEAAHRECVHLASPQIRIIPPILVCWFCNTDVTCTFVYFYSHQRCMQEVWDISIAISPCLIFLLLLWKRGVSFM